MSNKKIAFSKAINNIIYKPTSLDKLIFKLFGKKVISIDSEGDKGCKITSYGYRGNIIIFNIEYFKSKIDETV